MTTYGPHNPHPLSQMRTELVWEGKYDEFGNRREIDVSGLSMPLQKIETIDEPRSRAEAQGSLFDEQKAHRDDFRNRLIWGDNKLVMASLLEEFKGAIDLIYIDPPFDVGADFSMKVAFGDEKETLVKDQSILEMVAYRDILGKRDCFLSEYVGGTIGDRQRAIVRIWRAISAHWTINRLLRKGLGRPCFRNQWCRDRDRVATRDRSRG